MADSQYISNTTLHNHVPRASLADAGGISVSAAGAGGGGLEGHLGQAGQEAGATIGQSVVAIVAGLDGMNRRDVSNTLEFASRASNHIVKGNSQQWFMEYVNSISKLGWGKQAITDRQVDLSQVTTGTSFADLIKDLINADNSFTTEQKTVIGLTLDSLLKQQNRRALFNSFNSGGKDSTFSVTAATVKNGALAMRMVGFSFSATQNVTDCLLFSINKTNITIRTQTTDFFANQGTIDANRVGIETQLHTATGDYINDTPLD